MLSFVRVSYSYQGGEESSDTVLHDISFNVTRGEFVVILGENGAGKTTLCKLANGLLKPASGRVLVAGEDTAAVKMSRIARKVGYLFQNPDRQLCRNTVREEILFGLEYALAGNFSAAGSTKAQRAKAAAELEAEKKKRCDEMLALFHFEGNRDPFGLSRGERQQVALATVLARRPELLILDEPTTGLDYRECMTLMNLIANLNAAGTTVLMITHDMEVAADFGKRAMILNDGELIGDGPVREIFKNRALLNRASLLPPQIASLAINLGERFNEIFTLDEMCMAAEQAGGGGKI